MKRVCLHVCLNVFCSLAHCVSFFNTWHNKYNSFELLLATRVILISNAFIAVGFALPLCKLYLFYVPPALCLAKDFQLLSYIACLQSCFKQIKQDGNVFTSLQSVGTKSCIAVLQRSIHIAPSTFSCLSNSGSGGRGWSLSQLS